MRKMPTVIFLIVLVILVFVGCSSLTFKDQIEESTDEFDAEVSELASQAAAEMEAMTDAQGVTIYSPEQISEYIKEEFSTSKSSGSAATSNGAAVTSTAAQGGATQAPSGNQGATQAPAGNTTSPAGKDSGGVTQTTAGQNGATSAAQQPATQAPAGSTEFDILRSGKFYIVGSMKSGEETMPLEMGITDNTLYMRTQMEGIDMAVLQDANKKMYMIVPSKQIYIEMSSVVMSMMGMSADDLFDADSLGFSDTPELSQADTVAEGEFNGSKCTIYTFNSTDGGRTVAYLNGNKLLGFENVVGGSTSTFYINSISATVPADKSAPPSNYKKVNMLTFMSEMKDVMGY